jgi:DNA-binding SARP family transcriptional activator
MQTIDSTVGGLSIKYRLLGPLEIVRNGKRCTPRTTMQRALLALLIYNANELLTTRRLIDELWDSKPPASALATLQMYVSAVRRALFPTHNRIGSDPRVHPILRTENSGYIMRINPADVDLTNFRALAEIGRSCASKKSYSEASEHFGRALALWRGSAMTDLSHIGMLAHYAFRLDEERITVWQERIRIDICQGRTAQVIGELGELCARYPLREPFYLELMLALYQSDRRAEALEVYARAHQIIVENVGLEPGPGLRAAQNAILTEREPPGTLLAGHWPSSGGKFLSSRSEPPVESSAEIYQWLRRPDIPASYDADDDGVIAMVEQRADDAVQVDRDVI